MSRVVETTSGLARIETFLTTPKEGTKIIGLSAPVRLARIGYAVLSSVLPPLLMAPMAFAGRLSWGLRLLPLGLLVLIGVQYVFANAAVPAAALHPVNALLILCLSLLTARRALAVLAEQ
jgi:hypothetical protein